MELLIVIFIVSLVYFLGFDGVEKATAKRDKITPLTLKSTIAKLPLFKGKGTLLCTNRCRTCYLREDLNSPFEEIDLPIELGKLKAYLINSQDELFTPDFGRYHDNKICLILDFYANGSSTQVILQNEKGIYFLPAFFGDAQSAESLQEAKEMWLAHTNDLKDRGSYY